MYLYYNIFPRKGHFIVHINSCILFTLYFTAEKRLQFCHFFDEEKIIKSTTGNRLFWISNYAAQSMLLLAYFLVEDGATSQLSELHRQLF